MIIVITLPYFFDGEAEHIARLLQSGIDLIHIRKPKASAEEIRRLLFEIPAEYRARLVLHDHFQLAEAYGLHGVHLNNRNPFPPQGWAGSVSRSCHTLEEVMEWKPRCDYVSLSPIFDSISKQGYRSAFSLEMLKEARLKGIVDSKVFALGGVTFSRIDGVLNMGFGGAMILGDAWKTVCIEEKGKEKKVHDARGFMPIALSIAGSDSSAGAGIQQDIKAMAHVGIYCATVITAITSQNTLGVQNVMPIQAQVVESQLSAVLSDMNVSAVKIGMIPNADVAHTVATVLKKYKRHCRCDIIYDPVMISTSGHRLMAESTVNIVKQELLPICSLVTPNLLEVECLLGHKYLCEADGWELTRRYSVPFLIKGGHRRTSDNALDVLFLPNGTVEKFESKKIESHNLHGTGCTLSSAIAAFMVSGKPLASSIMFAKRLVSEAIVKGKDVALGRGNGPLLF